MKICFEIDEQTYRLAIVAGWKLRMDEDIEPNELNLVPNPFDLTCALSTVPDTEITNVKYER